MRMSEERKVEPEQVGRADSHFSFLANGSTTPFAPPSKTSSRDTVLSSLHRTLLPHPALPPRQAS